MPTRVLALFYGPSLPLQFWIQTVYLETPEGKIEEYTILGPWESDPENNIISYMTPFGTAIFNSKKGEKLSFVINEEKHTYTVKDIKVANI